jgi:hypothetical protein
MPLALKSLLTMHADLHEPQVVGDGPWGNRQIFVARSGWFTGDRLQGSILAGGGDWLVAGSDGFGRLDVRTTLQTSDGALIYVTYPGVIPMSEATVGALTGAAAATEFGDLHFLIQPRFETGDARYAWLNSTIAVGRGRVLAGAVEYEVDEVRASDR